MTPRRLFALFLISVAAGIILFAAYWLAWGPGTGSRSVFIADGDQEVRQLLDEASWLSAGRPGPEVRVIGYRDSAATERFLREAAPRLADAGVDVQVLMFARADRDGRAWSTPAERSTIAELWLGRDWRLFRRWLDTPSAEWRAPGLAPADDDLARTAVVETGRTMAARLASRLGDDAAYPLILWRDRAGRLILCACDRASDWARIGEAVAGPPPPPQPRLSPAPSPPPPRESAVDYPDVPAPTASPASPIAPRAPAPDEPALPERVVPPAATRPRATPEVRRPSSPAPRRSEARSAENRARQAPEARRDPDSTFF